MTLKRIKQTIDAHEERRRRTINLVASENLLSPAAQWAMSSDLAHRYCIPPAENRPPAIWDYPNQKYTRAIEEEAEQLAAVALGAQSADVRPLSGNNAAYILLQALVRAGGEIASVPARCGGHFATETICARESITRHDLPYDPDTGRMDVMGTLALCESRAISLIFLDASMQLFPHPVRELRAAIPDITISYDASHLMGLIAGGQFQAPAAEGASLIQGSTHKSLFGPQKALFAFARDDEISRRIRDTISPLFVSNAHPHHIAALAVALQEIIDFGKDYAAMVVANARRLAAELSGNGARISFREHGFTDCHQIFWAIGTRAEAEAYWVALEDAGLHVNLVKIPFEHDTFGFRVGVAEATRRGFTPTDMSDLAGLLLAARRAPSAALRARVEEFSRSFPGVCFGYDSDGSELPRPRVADADGSI